MSPPPPYITKFRSSFSLSVWPPKQDASMEPPDRGCLDDAHEAIVKLVKDDQYARYKDFIVVQRHLRVARLDALWWTQVMKSLRVR